MNIFTHTPLPHRYFDNCYPRAHRFLSPQTRLRQIHPPHSFVRPLGPLLRPSISFVVVFAKNVHRPVVHPSPQVDVQSTTVLLSPLISSRVPVLSLRRIFPQSIFGHSLHNTGASTTPCRGHLEQRNNVSQFSKHAELITSFISFRGAAMKCPCDRVTVKI